MKQENNALQQRNVIQSRCFQINYTSLMQEMKLSSRVYKHRTNTDLSCSSQQLQQKLQRFDKTIQ